MLLELFSNLDNSHISLPFQNIKHLVLSNKDEILTKTIMKALFKMLKIKSRIKINSHKKYILSDVVFMMGSCNSKYVLDSLDFLLDLS